MLNVGMATIDTLIAWQEWEDAKRRMPSWKPGMALWIMGLAKTKRAKRSATKSQLLGPRITFSVDGHEITVSATKEQLDEFLAQFPTEIKT